jgi:hypothetical protein
MLITFETKAYANITMFGDVAKKLIKYMGHSGTVPGAIKAEDLPLALEQLRTHIQAEMMQPDQEKKTTSSVEDDEEYISIDKRAIPLIELLEAAIEQNADVMWNS